MIKYLHFLLVAIFPLIVNAQIGVGTSNPDSSAILHIKSYKKGVLIPQISNLDSVYSPSANGLLVFFKAEDKFYVYDSIRGNWQCVNPLKSNNLSWKIAPSLPYSGFSGAGMVPVGGIIMWSGSSAPNGWVICNGACYNRDGTLGQCPAEIQTPNLAGKFIIGYDKNNEDYNQPGAFSQNAYNYGGANLAIDTGGLQLIKLKEVNIPLHSHDYRYANLSKVNNMIIISGSSYYSRKESEFSDNKGGVTLYNIASHTLISFSGETGYYGGSKPVRPGTSNTPFDNRPPYYVLAFIMRIR